MDSTPAKQRNQHLTRLKYVNVQFTFDQLMKEILFYTNCTFFVVPERILISKIVCTQ